MKIAVGLSGGSGAATSPSPPHPTSSSVKTSGSQIFFFMAPLSSFSVGRPRTHFASRPSQKFPIYKISYEAKGFHVFFTFSRVYVKKSRLPNDQQSEKRKAHAQRRGPAFLFTARSGSRCHPETPDRPRPPAKAAQKKTLHIPPFPKFCFIIAFRKICRKMLYIRF